MILYMDKKKKLEEITMYGELALGKKDEALRCLP
jgi:hypothetical protein